MDHEFARPDELVAEVDFEVTEPNDPRAAISVRAASTARILARSAEEALEVAAQ